MSRRQFLKRSLSRAGIAAGAALTTLSAKSLYFEYRDNLPSATAFYARFSSKHWTQLQIQLQTPGSQWHRRFCELFGTENLEGFRSKSLSPSLRQVVFKNEVATESFHKFMKEFNQARV